MYRACVGEHGPPNPAPPAAGGVGARNAGVYAAYATLVLAAQVGLFALLDENTLPLVAPVCLLILPAFAWLAGWITVGVAFRGPDGPVERTPKLGALICLLPNLLLCLGLGLLAIVR
jgi:hypothetical protein